MNPEDEGVDTAGWRPLAPGLSVFESIAGLFAPAAPDVSTVLREAGPRWRAMPGPLGEADVVLWGNPPAHGGPPARLLRWASRRERALRRLHSARYALRAVHRLPPAVRGLRPLQPLRAAILGGIVAELYRGAPHPRVIDEVLAAARARPRRTIRLRPSRDGSALARVADSSGHPLEMRVAIVGGRKDPGRNADALALLEAEGVALVPRLRARGSTGRASWTVETVLGGERPSRLGRRLHTDVQAFCASLPSADGPAASLRERMLALAERYPRWADLCRQLADHRVPARCVVQHGDLWIGNTLVNRGRLRGVIDWDTWHPRGVPGADLLQLHAMHRRQSTGEEIGDIWSSRLWRSDEFRAATRPYWRALRVEPSGDDLEAVSLDWWSGQLFKRQAFASQPGWVDSNVDRVLALLNGTA
jgi:hypothetical protein